MGWQVPNTNPQQYHNIDLIVNGSLQSNYTMIAGANYTSEDYLIPVTNGEIIDLLFTSLGTGANEAMYRLYDSQGNLVTTQGFPGSVPGNFTNHTVSCPATATYNYSWINLTSGGFGGLNDPNVQNPLATVAQVTNFQVKVQMLEVVDGMRPGMSATVDIITEERPGAIAIPIQALTTPRPGKSAEKKSGFSAEVSVNGESQWSNRKQFGDKKNKSTVVFVLKDDNTVEQRIVEAGIVGDRDYEIISGLEVDETIVTGSFIAISRELYDGAVVKVKENSRPSRKRD